MRIRSMLAAVSCAGVLALAGYGGAASAPLTPAHAARAQGTVGSAVTLDSVTWKVFQCNRLAGNGTFGHPYQLGRISTPAEVHACPALVSGAIGAYFSFTLPFAPPNGAFVATNFDTTRGESPVYEYVENSASVIVRSLSSSYNVIQGNHWVGILQYLYPLPAGAYLLRTEKTTLLAFTTSAYNIWINPRL